MKKRTAFIGAILSLIPFGQPLIIKNLIVLSSSVMIISYSEKILADSFNYDFKNALQEFDKSNYKHKYLNI